MSSGELDRRVTFLRRPAIAANGGNERGDYADLVTVWAGYTPMRTATRESFGYAEDVLTAWLKIRESSQIDSLTIADRVRMGGRSEADADDTWSIDSVAIHDGSGYRLLRISRKLG